MKLLYGQRIEKYTCGYLMSQAARSRMYHHTNLAHLINAHVFCSPRINNLINYLNFDIMISCSQCPQLRYAATFGALADLFARRIGHAAPLFAFQFILSPRIIIFHSPVNASIQNLIQILSLKIHQAFGTNADGNGFKKFLLY